MRIRSYIVKSSSRAAFTVFNTCSKNIISELNEHIHMCNKRNIKADPKQSSGEKKQQSDNFLFPSILNFKNTPSDIERQIPPQISHPTIFYVSPNSSCANMTICYNLLIINQWCVNSNGMPYLNSPPQYQLYHQFLCFSDFI